MKHFLTIIYLLFSLSFPCFAQEESAKPLTDTEVVRRVDILDIEGKLYDDVVVTMKSLSPNYYVSDKYRVKVSVEDEKGKKIWKKTLKNVYLYLFSDGQVQVGKSNFNQILIKRSSITGDVQGIIREKEGIW